MTRENITTSTCQICNGEREIMRGGIRIDCPSCDGFGCIVQSYTDSELMISEFDHVMHEIINNIQNIYD